MSREWTVVITGDWYLPHFVNMLKDYRGNGEQVSCATDVIAQIEAQMTSDALPGTRPLVVIDPECEEDVTRLADALVDHHGEAYAVESDWLSIQAALREFANPTMRPEEPTGLGAVVEDARGKIYVLAGDGWLPTTVLGMFRKPVGWDNIAVVRVLSEGVVLS